MNKKLLRKKLALILANLKKKRKYYCEVEYLESTGTQRIDTGIPFIAQDNYVIKARSLNLDATKRSVIVSDFYNKDYTALTLEWYAGNSTINGKARAYCKLTSSDGVNVVSPSALSVNVPHDLELEYLYSSKRATLYFDGDSATGVIPTQGTSDSTHNWCLFLDERPDPSAIQNPTRIYYLQIYHNNTLVRDFIPVLDWNYVPCMYDRVTEQ